MFYFCICFEGNVTSSIRGMDGLCYFYAKPITLGEYLYTTIKKTINFKVKVLSLKNRL